MRGRQAEAFVWTVGAAQAMLVAMSALDSADVRRRIEALRANKRAKDVFGASGHGFKLERTLTAAEVEAAEGQWGVTFPDDYRTFLLEVGRGGAGPAYGLFPLVENKGVWRFKGDGGELVSDLKRPFPHEKEWNAVYREMGEDEDEDAYWEERDVWDNAVYWHAEQTYGAICICHRGCAIRDWLVVTGPERGHVWLDDRASDAGLIPREIRGERATFAHWYLEWLAATERTVQLEH